MTYTIPTIDEHYAKISENDLYFYMHFDSPTLSYGIQTKGGWIVQIKINDDQLVTDLGFDYVLSPYLWNHPEDQNSQSTTQLYDSLSFRNVHSNGWVSKSLGIYHPILFPDFFALKVPMNLLAPTTGILTYDIWIMSAETGNSLISSHNGTVTLVG
jgi:hypothetical protein